MIYFLEDSKKRNEEETNYVNLCLKLAWTMDMPNNVSIIASWRNYIHQHFRNILKLMTLFWNLYLI